MPMDVQLGWKLTLLQNLRLWFQCQMSLTLQNCIPRILQFFFLKPWKLRLFQECMEISSLQPEAESYQNTMVYNWSCTRKSRICACELLYLKGPVILEEDAVALNPAESHHSRQCILVCEAQSLFRTVCNVAPFCNVKKNIQIVIMLHLLQPNIVTLSG